MKTTNIENLTIHKFRGLRDLTLESLGQINLLVGANNCGKTSVLEAVSTYCNPLDPLEWLNTAWRREIKSSLKPKLDALKWLFPQDSESSKNDFYSGETYVSGDGNFSLRNSKAIYQEFEGTQDVSEDIDDEDEIGMGNIRKGADLEFTVDWVEQQQNLWNDKNSCSDSQLFKIWENERFVNRKNTKEIALPVKTITPFSHRIEQLQVELLSEAAFQDFKPEIIELISTIDSGIIDLEILSFSSKGTCLYIKHKQTGISPLSAFGDGVRRLLFIASSIAKVKGGVLLIDELETAIHTEALYPSFSWLVKWCQQMDIQLFATTHSLETVDAVLDATEPETDLVLYRLEPQKLQTQTTRIDGETLQRLRLDLGREVRW